jgi:hypothetical protein
MAYLLAEFHDSIWNTTMPMVVRKSVLTYLLSVHFDQGAFLKDFEDVSITPEEQKLVDENTDLVSAASAISKTTYQRMMIFNDVWQMTVAAASPPEEELAVTVVDAFTLHITNVPRLSDARTLELCLWFLRMYPESSVAGDVMDRLKLSVMSHAGTLDALIREAL